MATYMNYVTHSKMIPLLGQHRPPECSVPVLRVFARTLPTRLDARTKRPISANHCWNILKSLTRFLDDCKYEGWSAPCENCARSEAVLDEMPKRSRTSVIALPIEWAQSLIECADVPFLRRVKYAVAFTSTMTDGEICGLNVEDALLNETLPVFAIKRACQAKAKEGWARPGRTKNEYRVRTVPMHSTAVQAVRLWARSWL